ncbi:MAG: hypothetical protein QOF98_3060, partial [Streptomyces sp.]|nr:hypothetical protein [Streptomyces sp.]
QHPFHETLPFLAGGGREVGGKPEFLISERKSVIRQNGHESMLGHSTPAPCP